MSGKIIYGMNNDEWNDSTDDENERADTDEETRCMNVEDTNIEKVSKFKKLIAKEPEFSGINQVSDYRILQAFLNPRSNKYNRTFTKFQLGLISELHYELCDYRTRYESCQIIANEIYDMLYI